MTNSACPLLVAVITAGVGGFSCAGDDGSDDDMPSSAPRTVNPADVVSVEVGIGSGLDGLDLVSIDAAGKLLEKRRVPGVTPSGPPRWELRHAVIHKTEMGKVRDAVARSGVLSLKPYNVSPLRDGTQACLRIRTTTVEFKVYCSNQNLEPVLALDGALRAALDEKLRGPAEIVNDDRSREIEGSLWDAMKGLDKLR